MKRFSAAAVNGARAPNVLVLQEYQARAQAVDHMTARLFGLIDDGPPNEPRVEVLRRRLAHILADVPRERHIAFLNAKNHKLFMFYSKTSAFLVEANLKLGIIKRSLHYGNVELAIHAWKHRHIKAITWVEAPDFPLPPSMKSSEPSPPG
jgi:hypothetical protein